MATVQRLSLQELNCRVPNAKEGRGDFKWEIFGMAGVPEGMMPGGPIPDDGGCTLVLTSNCVGKNAHFSRVAAGQSWLIEHLPLVLCYAIHSQAFILMSAFGPMQLLKDERHPLIELVHLYRRGSRCKGAARRRERCGGACAAAAAGWALARGVPPRGTLRCSTRLCTLCARHATSLHDDAASVSPPPLLLVSFEPGPLRANLPMVFIAAIAAACCHQMHMRGAGHTPPTVCMFA